MNLSYVVCFIAFFELSLSFPIDLRLRHRGVDIRSLSSAQAAAIPPLNATGLTQSADSHSSTANTTASNTPYTKDPASNGNSTSKPSTGDNTTANASALASSTDKAFFGGGIGKGSLSSSTSATSTSGNTPSAASVNAAVSSFAGDVSVVSNSLNKLATTTDPRTIRSLASAGFNAESDEDQHRAVLAAAAGQTGTTPNAKIVEDTPVVLNGLQAIMNLPTTGSVSRNLPSMQNVRNANILPSITQLSNMALNAVGEAQTAPSFTPTGQ